MATVSERSREIADKMSHSLCADREERQQRNAKVIEQALLAERRLAMEEAVTICEELKWTQGKQIIAARLRAAVSELDGPRGGE